VTSAGRLILETSTVVPQILIERAEAFAAKGAMVADAPISGGPEMVAAGTCGVFVGAEPQVAARAEPVLGGSRRRFCTWGRWARGMAMKTINNALLQIYGRGLREMLPVAVRAGISLEDVLAVLNAGPAGTGFIRDRMPKITGEDTSVGFTMNGVHKDNEVFRRVAESYGLPPANAGDRGQGQQARQIEEGLGEPTPRWRSRRPIVSRLKPLRQINVSKPRNRRPFPTLRE
jgi:3-hydroxyisobutyrate dehydrogenase